MLKVSLKAWKALCATLSFNKMKESTGPTIRAFPDIDIDGALESYNLERLKPRVTEYGPELKKLITLKALPNPTEASSTLPEIISFAFEIPGVEPTLAFQDFIRGVACCSLALPLGLQDAIKALLNAVALRVVEVGQLPSLSTEFVANLNRCMQVILTNNEPSSWRGLLAFMLGAYYLLGFVEKPFEARGTMSPAEYVETMVIHFAQLGYTPK